MAARRSKTKQHLPAWRQRWTGYRWWERLTFLIGLFSFIGIIVILFLPVGKGPRLYAPEHPLPPAGSAAFIQTMSDVMALPVGQGSRPDLLENGDAFKARFLSDIDQAGHAINMMNYIWSDGRFSDEVLAHLEKRVRSGVKVHILLDAYGSTKAPSRKFRHFESLGGKVATFRSLMPLPWTIMHDTKRNHRRSITIDGRIAYTGGAAIDDKWLGDARTPEEWHDIMLRFTGPVAARLQGSFVELWMSTTGQQLVGPDYFPAEPDNGQTVPYVTLSSSPSPDMFEMETFFLMSLWAAQKSIVVETPYFLPDASVRKALEDKARQGVKVTVLLPNQKTDEKSVRWARQRIYQELLEAGVKIHEYQPTFTHTKFLVVDDAWCVMGSANWDNRSRKLNDEVVIGMADAPLASTLTLLFQRDLARSQEITLGAWRHRGILQCALEYAAQTFVQQY